MTRATLYKAHEKHTKETCLVNFISATTFCMTLLKHHLSFIKLLYICHYEDYVVTVFIQKSARTF